MKKLVACIVCVGLLGSVYPTVHGEEKKETSGPQIAHMVYFTLKESTPAAKKKLVDACKKYLSGHDGTVYFSAGLRGEEFDREVNDRDWDVALHLVFKDKAAHDKYQEAKRHKDFIAENRDDWKKVRVFDASVEP